jgi:hypothetical protein
LMFDGGAMRCWWRERHGGNAECGMQSAECGGWRMEDRG